MIFNDKVEVGDKVGGGGGRRGGGKDGQGNHQKAKKMEGKETVILVRFPFHTKC